VFFIEYRCPEIRKEVIMFKSKNTRDRETNEVKDKSSSSSLERTGERRQHMALQTQSPFSFMRRFSEEMDRLFDDFGFGRGWQTPTFETGFDRFATTAWSPQVEVFERDKQLVVRTDLPGMTKDDIKVDITDDALVIRGERKSEREEDEEGFYRSERSYGTFYRQIPLPRGINAENATAEFRNGVLEISMPAPEAVRGSRRIEIGGDDTQKQSTGKAKAAAQK
jgi:HSP20 family protein